MSIRIKEDLYAQATDDVQAGAGVVRIDQAALRALQPADASMSLMSAGLQGKPAGQRIEHAVAFILVLNSLNWMFWDRSTDGLKTLKRYSFEGQVGAMGMRRAFDKAWGDDATPDTFRAALDAKGVTGIFGDISCPLLREQCLAHVLGRNLGLAAQAIHLAIAKRKGLTTDHALYLSELFPVAYQDRYLKRAQLALAEIAGHLAETGQAVPLDVTAFADYQVPRVLRGLGVLEYSDELAHKIAQLELIPAGSVEERAIRGATILACQQLADSLGTTEAAVDNYLWLNRNAVGGTPFHLTVTTDY